MRVEGCHKSGIRVVIIQNQSRLFEVYIYGTQGEMVKEEEFRKLESAKSYARKKYNVEGKWHWDHTIKLKAVTRKDNIENFIDQGIEDDLG